MRVRNRLRQFLALLAGAFAAAGPRLAAQQDDSAFDRRPRDCISTANLESTDVRNDLTILFFLRDHKVYRNHLPRTCPGLKQQGRFAFETASGRLCSDDTITVMDQRGSGFSCSLGPFLPLSEDEIDALGTGPDSGAGLVQIEVITLPTPENPPLTPPVSDGGQQ